jgi:hypothetical protein
VLAAERLDIVDRQVLPPSICSHRGGRALLKRFHKLPGRLTVRLTKGVPTTRVVLSKAVRFNQK